MMNQATLLTVLGCSSSLTLALLVSSPAIAAPVAPDSPLASTVVATTMVQVPPETPHTTTSGYTGDDSLVEALGCSCALCNPNREQASTPSMQN